MSEIEGFDLAPAMRRAIYQPVDPIGGPVLQAQGDVLTAFGGGGISGTIEDIGSYIIRSTDAIINTEAGYNGSDLWRRAQVLRFYASIKMPDSASFRTWIGVANQVGSTMISSDNPAGHYAGLQFSTARGDTTYKFIRKDGTTQVVLDSGIAKALNFLDIAIFMFSGNIIFEIVDTVTNAQFRQSVTTNLPGLSTNMLFNVGVETLAAASKQVHIRKVTLEATK